MSSYVINVVGDHGVGKTSFINLHLTGIFSNDVFTAAALKFQTNVAEINFNMVESMTPLPADAYIIMFDVKNADSYKRACEIARDIKEFKVICGNKVDEENRVVVFRGGVFVMFLVKRFLSKFYNLLPWRNAPQQITRVVEKIKIHKEVNCPYFDISVKSSYNTDKPFMALCKHFYPSFVKFE